jgi:Glycosyltransferase
LKIALDATYSVGRNLSGVGVYCREILWGLGSARANDRLFFCYRPHRILRSLREQLPSNARRRLLTDFLPPGRVDLFHGLNQRLPRLRFRRTVTTFHDLFVITGEYSTPEFRRRFTQQAQDAAQRSDLIATVSAFTASQVEALLGVERARIRVIPHGVHLPDPKEREAFVRETFVLHVGAIQKRKNVKRLVAAFERLPAPWRLVLAGSAGYGYEEIEEAIQKSPARDRISILGYITASTLRNLYARAGMLAFPSLDEGFGMPVLEAMAWGVPVVASNRSALPEVCADAALLVDPEDTEEIGMAMLRIVEDPVLRADLIRRGLHRAEQFPWSAAIERTSSLYTELVR